MMQLMDRLFLIQLLISFLVGGGATAVQTMVAERVSPKIAGVILAIPTTFAIGIFFMAWALSEKDVVGIIPLVPLSLGIAYIFLVLYILLAASPLPKLSNMIVSYVVSIAVWFACSLPIILFEYSHLWSSLAGWCVLAVLSTYILERKYRTLPEQKSATMQFSSGELIARSLFAGLLITAVVLLAKTLNPFWGGVFSVFPASWSSGLIILHRRHDAAFLLRSYHMAPIGATSILLYALLVMWFYLPMGFVWGTVAAYCVTLLYVWLFVKLLQRQKRPSA